MTRWAFLPLALLPGAAGFAAASLCPMRKDDGVAVPFRPPRWFFAAVWPVLYLAFGIAWFLAASDRADRAGRTASTAAVLLVSVPYALCTALLTAWIPVRAPLCRGGQPRSGDDLKSRDKLKRKWSFWILLAAAASAAFCVALQGQPAASRLLSLLLLCWLCVAVLMSAWEFTAPEYRVDSPVRS